MSPLVAIKAAQLAARRKKRSDEPDAAEERFTEDIDTKYGAKSVDDLYELGKKMKSGVSAMQAVNMMRKLG